MKESGTKKGFVLYNDYKDMCDDLTDEEAGQLFKAIFAHEAGEEGPHLEGPLKGIFHLIANQLDRDRAKYQDKVITNQKNGSLGGRPKKQTINGETQKNQTVINKTEWMSEKPDTDTDTETDTDTVIEREKDTIDTNLSRTQKGKDITEYTREEMKAAAVKDLIKAYAEYFGDSNHAKEIVNNLVDNYGFPCVYDCIQKVGKRAPSKRPKVPAEYIREMCRNGG